MQLSWTAPTPLEPHNNKTIGLWDFITTITHLQETEAKEAH